MATDGGLRQEFAKHIHNMMLVPIESWGTGQGVPDMHYCLEGDSGWVENKQTSAWALAHALSPEQVGWMSKYQRHGGRVLLAVRRQHAGGVRKGPPIDELWIFDHMALREIATTNSIQGLVPRLMSTGGPARWDWGAIRALMKERPNG